MKTSISEKIAYGMGDVACNVVYALTSGLIVYFYTNVFYTIFTNLSIKFYSQ